MAKQRYYNYRHYQGKANKAKTVLAVFLTLVIIIAVAVIVLMQRNVVYDETGTPHIELPWQEDISEEADVPPLELIIEGAEEAEQKKPTAKMPEEPVSEIGAAQP